MLAQRLPLAFPSENQPLPKRVDEECIIRRAAGRERVTRADRSRIHPDHRVQVQLVRPHRTDAPGGGYARPAAETTDRKSVV